MIELSTRFSGITTSDKTRSHPLSRAQAVEKAKANLRYIDRRAAVKRGNAKGVGPLRLDNGGRARNRLEGRAAIRRAIEARAARGGKNGSRVAEKMMFSLPNDFAGKPAREALERVLRKLTGDSEAVAFGVIHTDRPDNLHCHVLAVDGPESLASARRRRPNAKRVRRRDHLRMNDRGRPKEIRKLIADEINTVADLYNLTRVEHRSFKERGVTDEPGTHIGPQRIAKTAREGSEMLAGHRAPQRRRQASSEPPRRS